MKDRSDTVHVCWYKGRLETADEKSSSGAMVWLGGFGTFTQGVEIKLPLPPGLSFSFPTLHFYHSYSKPQRRLRWVLGRELKPKAQMAESQRRKAISIIRAPESSCARRVCGVPRYRGYLTPET